MSLFNALSQPASSPTGRVPRLRPRGAVQWPARLSAVLVWGVVGFVTAHWVLALMGQREHTALPVQPWVASEVDSQAVARALGAVPIASGPAAPLPDASGRYTLVGVVAEGGGTRLQSAPSQQGVALIAIDGQRARPYAVGSLMDGRWVVLTVTSRAVVLRAADGREPAGASKASNDTPSVITLGLPRP